MGLVLRPFSDPLFKQRDLLGLESLVRLRRRHHLLGIFRPESLDDEAGSGFPRHNGGVAVAVVPRLSGKRRAIEPQLALARRGVRTMALETVLRENRLDGRVVSNPSRHRGNTQGERRDEAGKGAGAKAGHGENS